MTQAPQADRASLPLTELSGEELRARIARARLYLIETAMSKRMQPSAEQERDHLAYLYKLQQEGRLYGSGPLDKGPAEPGGELSIVAAASMEDAEAIAKADPYQRLDGFISEVRAHTMNEGVACYVGRALSRRIIAQESPFDPDISTVALTRDELLSRAVGAPLQVVYLNVTDQPRPTEDEATGFAHFVWLRENEMAARLMSCGPRIPREPYGAGIWGAGIGVLATSRAQAEQIAAAEPSGIAGYRRLSVAGWTMNWGLAAPLAKSLVILNQLPGM